MDTISIPIGKGKEVPEMIQGRCVGNVDLLFESYSDVGGLQIPDAKGT